MPRLAFHPMEGGRFVVLREHVEYYPVSDHIMGEHVWVTHRLGTTDKAGKAKLEKRMGAKWT